MEITYAKAKLVTQLITVVLLSLQASTSLAKSSQTQGQKKWQVNAGFGVYAIPESQGSGELDILPFPFIDVSYRNRYFFNFFDGLGAYLYKGDSFTVKSSVGFGFGRDEDDDPIFTGTGDIDDAAILKLEAAYQLGKLSPFINVQQYLGGTDGIQAKAGIEGFFTLGSKPYKSPSVMISIAAEYSNDDHIVGYFGINEQQSFNSGLPIYTPEAGLSAANTQITLIFPLSNKWSFSTTVEYYQLIGDAVDSPLVIEEGQVSGGVFVTYRF